MTYHPKSDCPLSVSVAAFLLDALEPADRDELAGHLSGCDACRLELMLLAPLTDLLRRVREAPDAPPAHRGRRR